jgi:hypothetical protein
MRAVKPLEGTRIIAQFDGEPRMTFSHMTKPRKSTSFEIHLEPIRNEPIRNEEIRNEPIRLDEIPSLEIRNDPIHSEPIRNEPIPVIDLGGMLGGNPTVVTPDEYEDWVHDWKEQYGNR